VPHVSQGHRPTGFLQPGLWEACVGINTFFCSIPTGGFTIMVLPAFWAASSEILRVHAASRFGYTAMDDSLLGNCFPRLHRLGPSHVAQRYAPLDALFFVRLPRASSPVPTASNSFKMARHTFGAGKNRTEQRHVCSALCLPSFTSFSWHHRGGTGPGPLRYSCPRTPTSLGAFFTYIGLIGGTVFVVFGSIYHWIPPSSRAGC